MSKKYWVDYSSSVLIEAETAEEAEKLFWGGSDVLACSEISIDGIEEEDED